MAINYLLESYKRYLKEDVSPSQVMSAIRDHERVMINYRSNGEDANNGVRVIEVYAYGLTTKGYPVIRAYQNYGDTTTVDKNWKFFRLDRITNWIPLGQKFNTPASKRYNSIGMFNDNGDMTMSTVYMVARFDDDGKTQQELDREDLMGQLDNPVYVDQIRTKTGYVGAKEQSVNRGPVKGKAFDKERERVAKIKQRYGNLSSKFVSNKEIKKRLGYDENEPETDEMKKRIQMERDWMTMEKNTARKLNRYGTESDSYTNTNSQDTNGEKSMKKMNSLGNLKRGIDYDNMQIPKMNQDEE